MAYTLPGKKTKAFLEHCKTHFKHGLTYDLDAKRANSRVDNHGSTKKGCDFSAPQTLGSRISALAVFPSPREGEQ